MDGMKPYVVAFLIQAMYAGMILLSKAAFNVGMSTSVFVFYRQFAGTLFILPFGIIFERKSLHQLSLATFCKIFMLAFLGITVSLNVYGLALVYTSANLGATTINYLPVTTFVLAVLLRTTAIKFFRQTNLGLFPPASFFLVLGPMARAPGSTDILGNLGMMHIISNCSGTFLFFYFCYFITYYYFCFWLKMNAVQYLEKLPIQACIHKPAVPVKHHSVICCGYSFREGPQGLEADLEYQTALHLVLRNRCNWSDILTGLTYYLQAWVVAKKGPVFLAMTTPLNLIMTILGSMFLLGENVNLGSVLGGILLVISLYSVLWGKSKEERMEKEKQLCLPNQEEQNCRDVKETQVSIIKPTSLV
ncbi:hypothetical protein V6N12_060109 [Hibiscus sabdariffa]|uniref:WAT1-related protein n=1 Tax=Hibiscus sabdariffa TaxID=183260 RepID=A0ABR2D3G7_9ROSI